MRLLLLSLLLCLSGCATLKDFPQVPCYMLDDVFACNN